MSDSDRANDSSSGSASDPAFDPLTMRLFREGHRFDFFQAVRLLEWMFPRLKPIGKDGPAAAEVLRIAGSSSPVFPASAIERIQRNAIDPPVRIVQNFLTLTGASGVLPLYYAERIARLERNADHPEPTAMAAWFDLFLHRLASLFYRTQTKYRLPLAFEFSRRIGQADDPITSIFYALIGIATPAMRQRFRLLPVDSSQEPAQPSWASTPSEPRIDDQILLRFAGILASRSRPALGLANLLREIFRVPVEVHSFRGHWLVLDPDNQTRLGKRLGRNDRLGSSTLVGSRIWDLQGAFRIVLGPMDYATFLSFLPDRSSGEQKLFLLAKIVRHYVRDALDFDVQMVLRQDQVPALQMVSKDLSGGPRLGWNTWIRRNAAPRDAVEAVFQREVILRSEARSGSSVAWSSRSPATPTPPSPHGG